ncbi:MAG: hypothetical protein J6I55_00270 [Ruminococcus sp.]|nr:hypothetical protein [Ruminococcus sp.]
MKKTNKIAAAMAVMTMATSLAIPTASISASAKTTPAAVIMEVPRTEKHTMTSNLVFGNCGQRLSRPTAHVTCRLTQRHTTRHIVNKTENTTTTDGKTKEAEKSWWDKFCAFFGF